MPSAWAGLPALLKALAVALAGAGLAVSLLGVVVDYGAYYSVAGAQIGGEGWTCATPATPRSSRPSWDTPGWPGPACTSWGDLRASTPEPLRGRGPAGESVRLGVPLALLTPPSGAPSDPSRLSADLWFLALRERPPGRVLVRAGGRLAGSGPGRPGRAPVVGARPEALAPRPALVPSEPVARPARAADAVTA